MDGWGKYGLLLLLGPGRAAGWITDQGRGRERRGALWGPSAVKQQQGAGGSPQPPAASQRGPAAGPPSRHQRGLLRLRGETLNSPGHTVLPRHHPPLRVWDWGLCSPEHRAPSWC